MRFFRVLLVFVVNHCVFHAHFGYGLLVLAASLLKRFGSSKGLSECKRGAWLLTSEASVR